MKTRILLIGTLAASMFFASCSKSSETANGSEEGTKKEMAHEEEMSEEKAEVINLEQVSGEFTNGDITLKAGTYSFEVTNNGVDHEVGLVVAPKKEDITPEDHLQNAYVSEVVKDGETKASKGEVTLEKGEYVFFCPLNPTPQYTITVE